MEELTKAAEAKGLKVQGVRLAIDQLREINKPFIALVEVPKHYLAVTDFGPEGVCIIDPEYSGEPYLMPVEEFGRIWRGYALVPSEVKEEVVTALLTADEMKHLRGKVCMCCPESNNGVQIPNTEFDMKCVNPTLFVNTVNLNLVVQDTDFSYRDRGQVIAIVRTFNSDDSRDGPFGHSWTFNYNVSITENPDESIDVRRETGTNHRFTRSGSIYYYPPKGVHDILTKNEDDTYSLKLKASKVTQHFSAAGKLTSIVDRNGNTVTFHYDGQGRLDQITDSVGRITTINYGANGKISSIVDPLSRTVTYSYDANNNLTSSTNMAGTTVSYAYNSSSDMTAITTPKGTTTIQYIGYNPFSLASITDPLGNVWFYEKTTWNDHLN